MRRFFCLLAISVVAIIGAVFSGNRQTIRIDGKIENWRPFELRIMKLQSRK